MSVAWNRPWSKGWHPPEMRDIGRRCRYREDGHGKMDAETGVMRLQVKGARACWRPPEARRAREESSSGDFAEDMALPVP